MGETRGLFVLRKLPGTCFKTEDRQDNPAVRLQRHPSQLAAIQMTAGAACGVGAGNKLRGFRQRLTLRRQRSPMVAKFAKLPGLLS
jgi:hypothetical protein